MYTYVTHKEPLVMASMLTEVTRSPSVWFSRAGSGSSVRVSFTIPSKSMKVGIHRRATKCMGGGGGGRGGGGREDEEGRRRRRGGGGGEGEEEREVIKSSSQIEEKKKFVRDSFTYMKLTQRA